MTLASIIAWFTLYKYPILFLIAIVEGPVVMTMSGLMLRLGYASFWPLYLTLMAGDLVADVLWYAIGYYVAHPFARRFGHYFGITEELLDKTADVFHRHPNKILLLSKITMGFGFAIVVLMTAGMVKIPFKKFISFNAIGQFAWTAILISIGYFFGNLYLTINKDLQVVSAIAFVVIILLVLRGVNSYLRKKDLEEQL